MYSESGTNNQEKQVEKMKIEAVIVCVNYADFLAQTLPNNKKHLDKIVVVTDWNDEATVQVCKENEVDCIQTHSFYDEGAVFNKGNGINAGLMALDKDAWVLHMDSDIWLSPHMREVLDNRHLDKEAIYGIDRLMCHGWDNWKKFLDNPVPINELYYLVQARAFPIGSRVAHYNQPDGWFPIGFFQLWNPSVSKIYEYPTNSQGADHTDVVFAKWFPRGKRHLIGETYVIHLDSEKGGPMGANWNGRKTKWFGPDTTSTSTPTELVKDVEEVPVEPIKVEEVVEEVVKPEPPPALIIREGRIEPIDTSVKHDGWFSKVVKKVKSFFW